jgi:FkbM family methyltransferase
MPNYWTKNWLAKFVTFRETIRKVENWTTAIDLRLHQARPSPRLLSFRDGLNLVCRGRSSDWDVISELLLSGGYARALKYLAQIKGEPVVLDLGGNIGVFSLLAASRHAGAQFHIYEPAPQNQRQCEVNRLLNPLLSGRVHLHPEGVGGRTQLTQFYYNEVSPQSSGLYCGGSTSYPVQLLAFAEVVAGLKDRVALVKIDVEGAEFEILEQTPPSVWENVDAISIEIHDDPNGKVDLARFLEEFRKRGYSHIEKEPVASASYFLAR